MKLLIDNITTVALIAALVIQLIYWVVDKIKTKGDIEKLKKEMKDGINGVRTEMKDAIDDVKKYVKDAIDGVKRHDKKNQNNSLNIMTKMLKGQGERIKTIETKIENIEKKRENNNKAN